MNILHITRAGGIHPAVLEMYSSISDNLIILNHKKYKKDILFQYNQVKNKVKNIKIYYAKNPFDFIKKLFEINKKYKINLIMCICPYSSFIAFIEKLLIRKNVLFIMSVNFTEHFKATDPRNPIVKNPILLWMKTLMNIGYRTSHIVAVCNFIKKTAEKFGAKNVKIISIYGANTKLFYPKKNIKLRKKLKIDKNKVIFTAGRLDYGKGIEELIRALPLIKEKIPNAKLVIAGKGPLENKFKYLVKKFNLRKDVIFIGWRSNKEMPLYHNIADVFIMPTRKEGAGFTSSESMACGIPTIASNDGGLVDKVIHNKTGLLIRPENTEDIKNSIIKILSNKKFANKLGKKGLKHIKKIHNQETEINKLKKLILYLAK